MELNREQIKKALECCTSPDKNADCPLDCPYGDINLCEQSLMFHALSLIIQQETEYNELYELCESYRRELGEVQKNKR